jgi:hypothetical protein
LPPRPHLQDPPLRVMALSCTPSRLHSRSTPSSAVVTQRWQKEAQRTWGRGGGGRGERGTATPQQQHCQGIEFVRKACTTCNAVGGSVWNVPLRMWTMSTAHESRSNMPFLVPSCPGLLFLSASHPPTPPALPPAPSPFPPYPYPTHTHQHTPCVTRLTHHHTRPSLV